MVLFIILGFLIICLSVDAVVQYRRRKEVAPKNATSFITNVLNPEKLIVPNGVYFDNTHTWAYMEKNGKVQVGINDLLQHLTGKVTSIAMRNPGEKIKKGDIFMTINHQGKKLHIYSPISGKINTCNTQLIQDASAINDSPYGEGWIYNIEPINWQNEMKVMLMAEKAKTWMQNEYLRCKDFFTNYFQVNNLSTSPLVLQDGGSLTDNILAEYGPEVWEEFQTKFIDTNK
jgi:glycine cleavage system H lipoate-binding protein